eukprot:CAMPEP_0172927180 /NCGR_PEP_ID=MMETSP1075-20121228/217023_1 /TAXON_ID=2916 /ORGANISM="Ceratium fusus, Strain PA161109" /LENGTH=53 /DNA_ID=CAMNT_0013788393 /DNA_START=807 /DNA_END=968 /DNA_ORIENTATION=-
MGNNDDRPVILAASCSLADAARNQSSVSASCATTIVRDRPKNLTKRAYAMPIQ